MRFLLFTLYAPIGSFGEIAVGERRMSWARPGRSAVLGLVAAAQGIARTDEDAHQRLETGLHYAVRTDAPGRPLTDYHTAQTPKARKGRRFATRRKELDSDGLHTVLSVREWRTDACFTVSLWARASHNVDLDGVAAALRHPRFVLYVGRKSAPLGLPLNPEVVEADTFLSAFEARQPNDEERRVLQRIHSPGTERRMVAFDHDAPGAPAGTRVERRRDGIVSRSRWQFTDRLERVAPLQESEGA
ncbi:MAG: type I-E CRISPR-associated protein Cas5/CasD [Immundisolibacterales bacterium]|nr:type I-E CRISPR-associated protein Cas5/CasD [Immundisolibacterales bacterium]